MLPPRAATDRGDGSHQPIEIENKLMTEEDASSSRDGGPSTPAAEQSPTSSSSLTTNEGGNRAAAAAAPSKLSTSCSFSSSSDLDEDNDSDSSEDLEEDEDDAFATPDIGVLSVVLGFPVEEGEGRSEEGEEEEQQPPAVGLAVPQLSFSTPPGITNRNGGNATPRASKTPRTAPGIPLDAEGRPLTQSRFGLSASKAAAFALSPAATAAAAGAAASRFPSSNGSNDGGESFFTAIARPMPRPVRLDLGGGGGEPSSDVEVFSDEEEGIEEEEEGIEEEEEGAASSLPRCRSLFPVSLSSSSSSLVSRLLAAPLPRPRLATVAAFVAGCCVAGVLLMRTEGERRARRGAGGGARSGNGGGLVLSNNASSSSASSVAAADFSSTRPPPLACITVFETL